MTFLLSVFAPVLTAVLALLWAGFVGDGLGDVPADPTPRDLRTW